MEWSGDWSDHSPLWTPSLKQELGPQFSEFKDDGTFWMAFQDLVQHFMCVNICEVCVLIFSFQSKKVITLLVGEIPRNSSQAMARN